MAWALVDCRISEKCERKLNTLGFYTVKLPPSPDLPTAISSHPDTLIFKIENELFTSVTYCDQAAYIFSDLRENFPHLKIHFTSDIFGKTYPNDCPFNALMVGKKILGKSSSLSNKIKEYAALYGYEIVNTNQGYPACTTLKISDSSFVSSDVGMIKKIEECKVKVAKISNSNIILPPYEYGFIGGASGVYKDTVYFFGDISRHCDAQKIEKAIMEENKKIVSLSDEDLQDLGGIIFID